jgi:hypothetical protein
MKTLLTLLLLATACLAEADQKQIRVFIALCDNKTQGIVPVGEKIGNGNDPEANLYWGCSDEFGCRPILMTQQLMYPGSFLVHAAIEKRLNEGTATEVEW